jgi:hypothetical protein
MRRALPARGRLAALGAATVATALALLLALAPPPARAGALPAGPLTATAPAPSPGLKRVSGVAALWPRLLGEEILRPEEPLTGQLLKLDGPAKRCAFPAVAPEANAPAARQCDPRACPAPELAACPALPLAAPWAHLPGSCRGSCPFQ